MYRLIVLYIMTTKKGTATTEKKGTQGKTGRVVGYFDCRVWKKDTPRSARKMAEQGNRINLSVGFDEAQLPEQIKDFATLSEKSGRLFVRFKVFPKNCRVCTASARQIDFPEYDKIDGLKFDVIIEYSTKYGAQGTTDLNGCYVNNLQIIRRADVPFSAIEGESDDFLSGAEYSTGDEFVQKESEQAESAKDDLPF